jgi:Capsule polysaccharide biosynthesis protein
MNRESKVSLLAFVQQILRRLQTASKSLKNDWQIIRMARQVAGHARGNRERLPVVFFNASTRIRGNSQNAAFSLLTSWVVRLTGVRVVHFICWAGMSHCVLGTDQDAPEQAMPCKMCIRQSKVNTTAAEVRPFSFQQDNQLAAVLQSLSLNELLQFEQPLLDSAGSIPLGRLVMPSLRWRLRLQTLTDDQTTSFICREFMLSAWNVALKFSHLLENVKPQAAVLFNGMHFPEATAAWLCRQRGVRVITHESGFQPFSGYFVQGDVTSYPIAIPDMDLTPDQNSRLDVDLQKRIQGDFSMAGIQFWKAMRNLPDELVKKAARFKQVAAVFTNVIFDTTQLHANVIFKDMFTWLDTLLEVFKTHPETLFVVRAHPDEARPGKRSRESVEMWFEQKAAFLPNVAFIPPQERISSYELIRLSKFVLTYNSQIGLESLLMGIPALGAGQAPFVGYGTVYFERDRETYLRRLESFLTATRLEVPEEAARRTRRFMYYRYYRFSLPFGEYIESTAPTGYVRMKKFSWRSLEKSPTARALLNGILQNGNFLLNE